MRWRGTSSRAGEAQRYATEARQSVWAHVDDRLPAPPDLCTGALLLVLLDQGAIESDLNILKRS